VLKNLVMKSINRIPCAIDICGLLFPGGFAAKEEAGRRKKNVLK